VNVTRKEKMKISSVIITSILCVSMFSIFASAQVKASSPTFAGDFPSHVLPWIPGDPFPVVDDRVRFPTVGPFASFAAHWYAGSQYPSSSPTQNASAIQVSITIPPSAPRPDEFYYTLLSAWDSNSSYDQVGFCDDWGTWAFTVSYTTNNGSIPSGLRYFTYNFLLNLTPGCTYAFEIQVTNGIANYYVQNSTGSWYASFSTGGNYVVLSNGYRGMYNYQNYEEVWNTSDVGGAPPFNFNFFNNFWLSTTNSTWYPPAWNTYYGNTQNSQGYIVPTNVGVAINGNAVLVATVQPSGAMKTVMDGYFYVPTAVVYHFLKIHLLFSNPKLVGDQTSGTSGDYPAISNYPDGTVNIIDVSFISGKFGLSEGQTGWDYMADVVPDRVINIIDVTKASKNVGSSGSYSTTLSGVTVKFNTGQTVTPNVDGFLQIPQGATGFNVTQNGPGIGTMMLFW
jgi:hypothetical protein